MTHAHVPVAANTRLIKIGSEVFAVYGDDTYGWSVDPRDLSPPIPIGFRYRSFDELFFALVNMSLNLEGSA
jgi:hypothetical protein